MPSTFKSVALPVPAGTHGLLYTATGVTAVVFAGTISNIDTTLKAQYSFTLERLVGATYTSILTEIPVQFGQSLILPKIVLQAGESLYMLASTTLVLMADISILERT